MMLRTPKIRDGMSISFLFHFHAMIIEFIYHYWYNFSSFHGYIKLRESSDRLGICSHISMINAATSVLTEANLT